MSFSKKQIGFPKKKIDLSEVTSSSNSRFTPDQERKAVQMKKISAPENTEKLFPDSSDESSSSDEDNLYDTDWADHAIATFGKGKTMSDNTRAAAMKSEMPAHDSSKQIKKRDDIGGPAKGAAINGDSSKQIKKRDDIGGPAKGAATNGGETLSEKEAYAMFCQKTERKLKSRNLTAGIPLILYKNGSEYTRTVLRPESYVRYCSFVKAMERIAGKIAGGWKLAVSFSSTLGGVETPMPATISDEEWWSFEAAEIHVRFSWQK